MNIKLISTLTVLFLAGCSSMDEHDLQTTQSIEDVNNQGVVYQFPESPQELMSDEDIFNNEPLTRDINFYMRGLMQGLTSNLQHVSSETPVAVTSFIYLDGDEDKASLLGNQISESLMHEIHKVGIPVLDYKVTDYLRVTEHGDFIMTRDFNQLSDKLMIKYVVTGNLVKHQGGYLVNARVVDILTKTIVGSGQSFIPSTVASAVLSSTKEPEQPRIGLISG